jgi:glycosyltransferase involved in cell wall biosynthesis
MVDKIVIFSRSYAGVVGGVEKLSLRISEFFVSQGIEVHIVSFDKTDSEMFFRLPEKVTWHRIPTIDTNQKSSWRERFRRIREIRILLKKIRPDVFIGFQVGSFLVMRIAAVGLSIFSIAAERNAPTLFRFIKFGKFKYYFYQIALLTADVIAVQFDEYKELYLPMNRKRIQVTPNSVELMTPNDFDRVKNSVTKVLFVGRLTFQKNLEVLIDSFSSLNNKYFSLTVIGDGPSRSILENTVKTNRLNVTFLPFEENLSPYYLSHDVLCLPSRWEGFPNVVAEALGHGLPVIGFEKCAGVSSLVIPGVNGELAKGDFESSGLVTVFEKFNVEDYCVQQIRDSVKRFDSSLFESSWLNAILPRNLN